MEPKKNLMKTPPPSHSGIGAKNFLDTAWSVKVDKEKVSPEGSPSINLGLGIGVNRVTQQGKSAFKPAQLHELHQQSLILKYIVAGLPIPSHLLLPIWKSVARSFGSANSGIYYQYPSFIGFSPQGFDYRSMIDPEAGRCRRTDGKKWRCSRDVVPHQKYCERHMHRGRQRSRKLVEASVITSESGTTLNCDNTTTTINSSDSTNTKSNLSIMFPVNLQLATPSLNTSSSIPAATAPATTRISGINGNDNNFIANNDSSAATNTLTTCSSKTPVATVAKKELTAATTTLTTHTSKSESDKNVYANKDIATSTTGLMSAAADNNSYKGSNNDFIDGMHASCSHLNNRINIKRSSNNVNNYKAGRLATPGFGFSPKSVLQGGCGSSCIDYRNAVETEWQRCRRTDGKKWRCSRDVVPDEKYCGRHLHRGAKKLVVASQSVTVAAAAAPPLPASSVCLAPPLAIPKKADGHTNLDTNLSISISASPQQMTNDKGCPTSSSSSSDATTITDENGSISHLLALSP